MQQKKDIHDEIAKVAYELFENSGRIYGCEVENWLAAEKIVLERHAGEVEQKAETIRAIKRKKASGKTEPTAPKISRKTSKSSSTAKPEKNRPKKMT